MPSHVPSGQGRNLCAESAKLPNDRFRVVNGDDSRSKLQRFAGANKLARPMVVC